MIMTVYVTYITVYYFKSTRNKDIPDVIVKQNAIQTGVFTDLHPEFVILNDTEVCHMKIKTNNRWLNFDLSNCNDT